MTEPRLSDPQLQGALEQCRADYEAAKAALGEIGFICEGSLAEIHTCCRNPNCRCADPARRHGPYWQLTWKEAGKTVSRRLSAEEARLYREWIDNRRALESVIQQMQAISRRADESLLADIGRALQGPPPRQARTPRRRQTP
jgi:hypothetical protein